MTRVLDATFEAQTALDAGQSVWLVDMLSPAGSAGTLARIATGKVLDIAAGAASLSDFAVNGGTLDLGGSGGRLRIQFSSQAIETTVRYVGAGQQDVRGMIVQANLFRNVGASTLSGFPGIAFPIPSGFLDYYVLQKLVVPPPSTTYPGGPFNEDSHMRYFDGLDETPIHQAAIFSNHVQHPVIFSYGADNDGIRGWVSPGGPGLLRRDPTLDPNGTAGLDSPDPWGFHVRWEDEASTPNAYTQPVEVGRISVYTSRKICVFGLPPGYSTRITGGESTSHGAPVLGTKAPPSGGVSIIDLDGEACPYDTIIVTDDQGVDVLTLNTWTDDIWGGDCFQYVPPAPTRIAGWTNADEPVLWGADTYAGLGRGNLIVGGVQEKGELRGQRIPLQFSAVDTASVLDVVKGVTHRGALFRVYLAKLNPDYSVAGVPQGPWEFISQEGIEAEELFDTRGNPRGATVSIPLASELSLLKRNPGTRTNVRSHQRQAPGDTGMHGVPRYAAARIFWGEAGPWGSGVISIQRGPS